MVDVNGHPLFSLELTNSDSLLMQCPDCGTRNTRVIETRTEADSTIIRRRHECGNLHRFNTYQIHETTARRIGLVQLRHMCGIAAAGIASRAASWLRRRRVEKMLAAGASLRDISAALGLTTARIGQIRRATAEKQHSNK